MEEIQIYGKDYQDGKELLSDLKEDFRHTGEYFVSIGYKLRLAQIRPRLLEEMGYQTLGEMARKEFGLDKTYVSRFIRINERFSAQGFSDRLKEQYRGMEYTKLTLMLSLPDEINEELSPAYSKNEIRAIKEEFEAETKATDIEVILEGEDPRQRGMESRMEQVLHQLLKDEPETFRQFYNTLNQGEDRGKMIREIWETLAPNGEGIKSVKIQGVARFALSIKGEDKDLVLTNMRHPEEKETCTWEELLGMADRQLGGYASEKEAWESAYGEPYQEPEKPEVAPVQPEEKKPAQRKVPRVTKAKVKEPPKEEPVQQDTEEEQLPGQTNIIDFLDKIQDKEKQEGSEEENHEEQEGEADPADCAEPAEREGAADGGEPAEGADGEGPAESVEAAGVQEAVEASRGPAAEKTVQGEREPQAGRGKVQQASEMPPEEIRKRRKEYETAIHLAAEELLKLVDCGTYERARAKLLEISRFLAHMEVLPKAEEGEGLDEEYHAE